MKRNEIKTFVRKVKAFHAKAGRHHLPWRTTTNPYHVLVSEIMLQQTQVDRVLPKYEAFTHAFPTVRSLADAPFPKVLRIWNGLGYNRRARFLHIAAKEIVSKHGGVFPRRYEDLVLLPGVGPYTAGAVSVFAFKQPLVLLETNIRTVYLHEFFLEEKNVHDSELKPYIEATLDREQPHEWYAALMDYGSFLKKATFNPSRKSAHYVRQKPFKGSLRQVRGKVLKALVHDARTERALAKKIELDASRVATALSALHKDGLVERQGRRWRLAT